MTMQGPSPAPTIVCFVRLAQWKKSHVAKSPFLALHDEERFSRHDEEVLLVDLPVVHRHRLARQQHLDVHADLRELLLALEVAERTAPVRVVPARVPRVEDEPPVAGRDEPVLGLLELRLPDHATRLPHAVGSLQPVVGGRGPPSIERMARLILTTTLLLDGA